MAIRKIIGIKQNGEKVWLKGHTKAISVSDSLVGLYVEAL